VFHVSGIEAERGWGDRVAGTGEPNRAIVSFREWAGAFLGAALFIILDPLGLSDGADRLSERIALGVAAPLNSLVEPGRLVDSRAHAPRRPCHRAPG
jgi:hypothetical protein